MNKKIKPLHIFIIIAIIFTTFILFYFLLFKTKTTEEIFTDSINSIVELKSSSDYGDSFGTAVIIDSSGRLITNAHVVTYIHKGELTASDVIKIRFASDNKYYSVKLLKYDTDVDLALLEFNHTPDNIKSMPIGKVNALHYGDDVYSIGNSMNYGISITKGIISIPHIIIEYEGKKREVIQADITISSGNSGGALLNSHGQLIGITSFRTNDSSGNIVYGLGYSIPINKVQNFLNS